MKLLTCHVENFGKLSKVDYNFNSEITCFLEENGAGKTTLASFIKAMFYGLESYKINSTDFCDRQHFYPFNGGNFGGNLTFELSGNVYKIERFFGEKSQTQDTLVVYKNGDVTLEFGADVGKAVFGIDKQSFERTAFISSDEIEIKSTSSINTKLSGFLQGNCNDLDVDDAVLSLEKLSKEIKKTRGSDKISAVLQEISILNEKISNTEAISSALESKYRALSEYEETINTLTKKSAIIQKQQQALSEWEYYERVKLQILDEEKQVNLIKERYGGCIPPEAEVDSYSENVILLRELTTKAESGMSSEDTTRLNRLENAFVSGVPTYEEIQEVSAKINKLSSLNAKLKVETQSENLLANQSSASVFANNPPTKTKLEELENTAIKYKEVKKEYDSLGGYSVQNSPSKSGVKYGIMAVFALVLAVFGVINITTILGVVLTVAGGLALVLAGFLYLSEKVSKSSPENPIKVKLQLELKSLEDTIKSNILPYGYFSGNGVLYDYATFLADLDRFTLFTAERKLKAESERELSVEIENLNSTLKSFFDKFGFVGDNYLSNLSRLQSGIDELSSLRKRAENLTLNIEKTKQEISLIKSKINEFLQKYKINGLSPNEVLVDVKSYGGLVKSIDKLKIALQEYKKEKNLTEKPQVISESLDDVNNSLRGYQRDYSALKHQILEDEYAVDRLDGYYIDKQTAENNLKIYKDKYKLLTSAITFLRLAEQNLKDKYVKPVKDEFIKYANLLEEVLGEKVTMTKDFEIRFERAGKERIEKHLSSGIKSICAFCFRIAMLKNMYKDAMPFLVLDDPFVNLDEEHIDKVKRVLKELSLNMQIVYFTCHSSRKI